jgi:hypothetical protein
VNEVVATPLEINALARCVSADKNTKGIFCRICVEAALQLFAALKRRRAGKGRDPIVGLQIVKRFRQTFFDPAPCVLVFGEENKPPVVPVAIRRHVCPDPLGHPFDARIGSRPILSGDLQHLIHECKVRHARRDGACRLGGLVLRILDQLLPAYFINGLILRFGTATDEFFCCGLRPSDVGAKHPFAMNFQGFREGRD